MKTLFTVEQFVEVAKLQQSCENSGGTAFLNTMSIHLAEVFASTHGLTREDLKKDSYDLAGMLCDENNEDFAAYHELLNDIKSTQATIESIDRL